MFENVGRKIKSVARILCWTGTAITMLFGCLLGFGSGFAILGVVLLIFGPVGSWIGASILYGFGELIEKTTEIAENTRCDSSCCNTTDWNIN